MFRSVCSKLLAGILLPLILIYGVVAVRETLRQVRLAIVDTELLVERSAERQAALLETEFAKVAAGMELVRIYLTQEPDASSRDIEAVFRQYLEKNPSFLGLFLAYDPERYADKTDKIIYVFRDKDGTIRTESIREYDYSRHVYIIPYFTQKDFWTEPYINIEPQPIEVCSFSVPFSHNGKPAGVAVADILLDKIHEIVHKSITEHTQVCLVSPTGALITDDNPEFEMNETIFSLAEWYHRKDIAEWGHRILKGKTVSTRFAPAENDLPKDGLWNNENPVWVVSVPVRQTGWTLIAATDETEILKPVYAKLYQQAFFFLFGLLLITGVVCTVSLSLTHFLRHLTNFAKELSAGNLYAKVYGKRPNDEFGDIAETFDRMAVELRSGIDRQMKESLARKAIEEELLVARRIQTSLLPQTFPAFPNRPEFDLYAKNEPATYIAGDFYDFFFVDDDLLALVIADVSGHGIPAAMFMAISRTVIRNLAVKGASATEIVRKTNDVLSKDNDDQMFVTVFLCLYNVNTGELQYVNAGHNPPYLVHKDGNVEQLPSTGPFIAAFEDARFTEAAAVLQPDDVLVMFTDGVTDAHAESDSEMFGEARLEALITENRDKSVYRITDAIFNAVDGYDIEQHYDDVTVLVLKRC